MGGRDEMEAGPELDALRIRVAVEVFGWRETDKRLPGHDPNWLAYEAPWYEAPDGSIFHYTHMPDYPRKIADAWLVVEKLRERGLMWRGGYFTEFGCDIGFGFAEQGAEEVTFKASADTAPLAICLAALKAMENK
jgi:hypothetical protein